jgi:hypothetical protein
MLQKKQNHAEEAADNLIHQFKGKTKLEVLLRVFAKQVQELENVFFDLLFLRSLDKAFGFQLDELGRLLDLEREGRNDKTYRQWLKARIRLNLSSGTPEDIIALIRAMVGDKDVEIIESFPAHFDVKVNEPINVDGNQVSTLMLSGKPAGVRGIFHWYEHKTPFVFDGDPGGLGFNQGKFAGAVDF